MALAPNENTNMPPFADVLNNYLNRFGKSPSALSRKLNISVNGLLSIRKRKTVQMELLWKLSTVYRHNFIADIAAMLPPDYTGALQDALAGKDKEIAAMQSEMDAMAKEIEIYKNLLKRE